MEVTAKQTTLHEQTRRLHNQGVESQKEVFERIKSRSKSRSPTQVERGGKRRMMETESQRRVREEMRWKNERRKREEEEGEEEEQRTAGVDYNRLY